MTNKRTIGMSGGKEGQSPIFLSTIGKAVNDQARSKKEPVEVILLKNFKIYMDCYFDDALPLCDWEFDNCQFVHFYDELTVKEEIEQSVK